MVEEIRDLVRLADKMVANVYLSLMPERGALLCFLFHSLFRDEREIGLNVVNPLQRTTVADFRQFVEYYLQSDYRFAGLEDLGKLEPGGKYAMITFDDGYFSNALARPILEEFSVPGTFFISTNHVRQNKSYWWDVLYREMKAAGASEQEMYREGVAMKKLQAHLIEEKLRQRFGERALEIRGDIDRPFSPAELREFAQSPMVTLGNHTADHAILTNYTPDGMREQISLAQEWLKDQTSKPISAIAYPDGACNKAITDLCTEMGFQVGFGVDPKKNLLPIDKASMLRLNRFATHHKDSIASQCRMYRSDLQIYKTCRGAYLRLAGRRVTY
jgi:peptidoglycan/xylan/chitin deacetylase (PgdA/CDA1 family)